MYLIIDYWMILEKRPRYKTWHAPGAFGEYVPWERPLSLDCNLAFRDALDPLIKQFCLLFHVFYSGLSIQSPRIFLSTTHQTRSFERGTCWYNRWLWLKTLDIRSKSENWETDCIKSEEPSCQDVRGRWIEREREVAKMSCNANRLNSFQTSIIIPTKMIESSKVLLKHLRLSSLPSSFLSTFSERNHPNHPIEKTNPRSQNWKLNSSNWTAYAWLCAVLCTQRASSWRFGLQKGPIGDGFSDGLWVKKLRFAVPCRKILGNTYVVVL